MLKWSCDLEGITIPASAKIKPRDFSGGPKTKDPLLQATAWARNTGSRVVFLGPYFPQGILCMPKM